MPYIVSLSDLKMVFSNLSQAKYHCLLNASNNNNNNNVYNYFNLHYFMSSNLYNLSHLCKFQISVLYKSFYFINSFVQIFQVELEILINSSTIFRSSNRRCSIKKNCSETFCDICKTLLKRHSNTAFFCEYREIYKNNFFEKHLRTAASAFLESLS